MAQRRIVELIDDLDQTIIDGDGGTHTFSLDGVVYEIDLSASNADKLRAALDPFIQAGRRAGRGAAATNRSRSKARSRTHDETNAIRVWARANGLNVSDRGRIPEAVVSAYHSA